MAGYKIASATLREVVRALFAFAGPGVGDGATGLRTFGTPDLYVTVEGKGPQDRRILGISYDYADNSFVIQPDRTLTLFVLEEDATYVVESEGFGKVVEESLLLRLAFLREQVALGYRAPTQEAFAGAQEALPPLAGPGEA